MLVRALDSNHDWTFGLSKQSYLSGNDAVTQLINTRLNSFYNNCFFDLGAGIDWFTFCGGSKNQLALQLAISTAILNTQDVTGILQLFVNLNATSRSFQVIYKVQTAYSVTGDVFEFDLGGSV